MANKCFSGRFDFRPGYRKLKELAGLIRVESGMPVLDSLNWSAGSRPVVVACGAPENRQGGVRPRIGLRPKGRLLDSCPLFRSTCGGGTGAAFTATFTAIIAVTFYVQIQARDHVKIFSGNSNLPLARAIAASIGIELGRCAVSAFPDGETFVKIDENVRGEDVFLVQSTSPPTNHHLMEMFIMIDALRRASAT